MAHAQQDSSAPADAGSAPELDTGIAHIFARLRDAGEGTAELTAEGAAPIDDGATFDLLGELDRLWRDGA
jgi:hypothetical protein